nr:hypothetical protein GCM10020093_044990 [Planobispora longispora]
MRDSRGEEPVEEEFRFDGGISEFTDFLARDEALCDVLRLQGVGHFHETVPVLDDLGHMHSTEVQRELTVDVALRWGKGYDTTVRSFVNVIATPKGGTHVNGFERAMVRTVNEQLRETRLLKNGDAPVTRDDIFEGLTAVVTVRVPEPQFEGRPRRSWAPRRPAGSSPTWSPGSSRSCSPTLAHAQAAAARGAGEDRRGGQGAHRRP